MLLNCELKDFHLSLFTNKQTKQNKNKEKINKQNKKTKTKTKQKKVKSSSAVNMTDSISIMENTCTLKIAEFEFKVR